MTHSSRTRSDSLGRATALLMFAAALAGSSTFGIAQTPQPIAPEPRAPRLKVRVGRGATPEIQAWNAEVDRKKAERKRARR